MKPAPEPPLPLRDPRQKTGRITGAWPSNLLGPKNHGWIAHALRLGGTGRIEPLADRDLIGWRLGRVRMVLRGGRPTFVVAQPTATEGSE